MGLIFINAIAPHRRDALSAYLRTHTVVASPTMGSACYEWGGMPDARCNRVRGEGLEFDALVSAKDAICREKYF